MKAYEMFTKMTPALGESIIAWLRGRERDVYRTALNSMAEARRLRPIFVTRKSAAEQAAWILEQLRLRSNEGVGENLLQIWLMKDQNAMLVSFLDAVGVSHDGTGGIDGEIPARLDPGKVKAGAAALLEKFPAENVAVYLHLFQLQQPGGWDAIRDMIASEPRLKLGAG